MKYLYIILINIVLFFILRFCFPFFMQPNTQFFFNIKDKDIIEFKISHSFFSFNQNYFVNYDKFLIYYEYDLEKIHNLIQNRPESIFYPLIKYLYEENKDIFNKSCDDLKIIYKDMLSIKKYQTIINRDKVLSKCIFNKNESAK